MAYANDEDGAKQRAATARHYRANAAVYKRRARIREKEVQAYIREQKTKCSRCSETFHRCLDFHHIGKKEFNIGEARLRGFSKERVQKEIDKCELLCANCHRKETYAHEFVPVA